MTSNDSLSEILESKIAERRRAIQEEKRRKIEEEERRGRKLQECEKAWRPVYRSIMKEIRERKKGFRGAVRSCERITLYDADKTLFCFDGKHGEFCYNKIPIGFWAGGRLGWFYVISLLIRDGVNPHEFHREVEGNISRFFLEEPAEE